MGAANLRISVVLPRMLSAADAAEYIGVPKPKLRVVCPIQPVEMPDGKYRYDVRDLDTWIDGLKDGSSDTDVIGRLG